MTRDGSGIGSGTSVSHSRRNTELEPPFSIFTVCTIAWPSVRVRRLTSQSRNC